MKLEGICRLYLWCLQSKPYERGATVPAVNPLVGLARYPDGRWQLQANKRASGLSCANQTRASRTYNVLRWDWNAVIGIILTRMHRLQHRSVAKEGSIS